MKKTQKEINQWETTNFYMIKGWEKDFIKNIITFFLTNKSSTTFEIVN